MNPTLIAGFEDVMGFIKSQELRIKNVEQNEKVRELKVQELFLENKKLKADDVYQQEIIQKYNEENTMLHEQIKKLKDHLAKYKEAESYLQPFENPDGFCEKIKELKALVDGEWRCADAENEHPEDALAKEGFASEAEYQAWKKKAMGIPVDDTVLYPTDTGEIIDPESRDVYTFGNSCRSSIEENCKMSRIIRNGHKKDCVEANAFCMIIIDGKLYYVGRSGSGPVHVRTIKGEKTTITTLDLGSRWVY